MKKKMNFTQQKRCFLDTWRHRTCSIIELCNRQSILQNTFSLSLFLVRIRNTQNCMHLIEHYLVRSEKSSMEYVFWWHTHKYIQLVLNYYSKTLLVSHEKTACVLVYCLCAFTSLFRCHIMETEFFFSKRTER